MMLTPAGRQRTLAPLMTISSAHAGGAQAVPAGEPLGAEALAIVALRQRHRQSCGCSCLYTGGWHATHSMCPPLQCSLIAAQVRRHWSGGRRGRQRAHPWRSTLGRERSDV